MSMIDLLKKDLADNYHDKDDVVINNMIDHYSMIASNASNRKKDDKVLEPYIFLAVKEAYLRRGDEGTTASNEGGLSSSYIDIEEKLIRDIRSKRVIR